MTYNFKSCRSVIYRGFDMFNIEGSEWESRAPEWIANGLLELTTPKKLKEVTETYTTEDYRIQIPCNLKLLQGITYKGIRLNRSTKHTSIRREDKKIIDEYTVTDNGWIYFDGIENDDIEITYKYLPMVWDSEVNRMLPLIPDNEEVEQALVWYCMRQLLYRGYKHPVINFQSNRPDLNPSLAWEHWKRIAVRAISSLDADTMYRLSLSHNSILTFMKLDHKNKVR